MWIRESLIGFILVPKFTATCQDEDHPYSTVCTTNPLATHPHFLFIVRLGQAIRVNEKTAHPLPLPHGV